MLARIHNIKNLGSLFRDYKCCEEIPDFKRFNLIYGWNGSGKTTLTRLFDAIGGSKDVENLEYKIEDDQGRKFTHSNTFNMKIRVFNQDYIKNNLKIVEGQANSIRLIIGQENKELAEQIKTDERHLNGDPSDPEKIGKIAFLKNLEEKRDQKIKEEGNKFSEIAKTIGASIGGQALRTYRKQQAETDFYKLSTKCTLLEPEIKNYSNSIKQTTLPIIDNLELKKISIDEKELEVEYALKQIIDEAVKILIETAESEVISRLAENSDISEWVEQGVQLHKKHNSYVCEYCLQTIPIKRKEELAKHFSEKDEKIKKNINNLLLTLGNISSSIETIETPDKANLYDELRRSYSDLISQFKDLQKSILDQIEKLCDELKNKKIKTSESVTLKHRPNFDELMTKLQEINNIISEHNKKSTDFDNLKKETVKKITNHYLSTIFDEVYELDRLINELNEKIDKTMNGDPEISGDLGIEALRDRIADNRAKISSTHKAAEMINNSLKTYLGHNELNFVPSQDNVIPENIKKQNLDSGYLITRGDDQATFLSEGEKTAIAFVYFTVHLDDTEFNKKDGIVVIDDPISSLDANLLFRVCSYIQYKLLSVGQLFLFTHNYDFFNQMKKWFINKLNSDEDEEKHLGEFYMIANKYNETQKCRIANLSKLDDLLKNYESEYHYLFKKLVDFCEDNMGEQPTIKMVYDYPNLARKLLECFLSFRVPKKGSFFSRLMGLKKINKNISSEELGYVYSFVNSHSHLDTKNGLIQFDPTLTLNGTESTKLVLKIIEQADKWHFKDMKNAIKK